MVDLVQHFGQKATSWLQRTWDRKMGEGTHLDTRVIGGGDGW